MSDANKVVLVKLLPGQELVCRLTIDGDNYVLRRPAVVMMTQQGSGIDNWPMFIAESVEEVTISKQHVMCVVPVHEKLEESYLRFLGETVIVTPQKSGLVLP